MDSIELVDMRAFKHTCAMRDKHTCASGSAYASHMESAITLVLADNVRRLMEHEGLSQGALAKRAGISQRAVGYLVNYKDVQDRHPTTPTIEAVAKAFRTEAWMLMIPHLPVDVLSSKRFAKLIENYLDAPEEGRNQVERIAESEVRYAVAEKTMTGTDGGGIKKSR